MSSRVSPAELGVVAARWATREGATEAEVYVSVVRGYSIDIKTNKIETLEVIDDAGVGIRVAVGKRTGFAYTTGLEFRDVKEAVARAVKQAKAAPEDKWWHGFPGPSRSYPEPGNIFNPVLARIEPETVLEHAREMLDTASAVSDLVLARGSISVYRVERAVVNTNGVHRIDVGTTAVVTAGVTIRREGLVTPMIYEFDASRVAIPETSRVVERAAETAKLCTTVYRALPTGRYTVVLAPKV
ncbi:MAG TPA: hypothetical protein EYP33_02075, partial [Pyrodictium sp.]|nr:hypothetical protein [Pyrodictium sp.]